MTRRYTSLGCGADVRSSREDCPPPRDNPPSVRQSARHAGTELSPGTFSPRETYDSGATSYDSPLRLPWRWGRGSVQPGGLPTTQGQPSKCPAVGQACWNRAKSRHLLTPRNLRLWSLSLCPEFQLSGQQLSGYDSGFSASAQSFNFLGSNFPIMTQD